MEDFNVYVELGKLTDKLGQQGRRDLWAAIAMHAILGQTASLEWEPDHVAETAYKIADCMEAERRKHP